MRTMAISSNVRGWVLCRIRDDRLIENLKGRQRRLQAEALRPPPAGSPWSAALAVPQQVGRATDLRGHHIAEVTQQLLGQLSAIHAFGDGLVERLQGRGRVSLHQMGGRVPSCGPTRRFPASGARRRRGSCPLQYANSCSSSDWLSRIEPSARRASICSASGSASPPFAGHDVLAAAERSTARRPARNRIAGSARGP